MNVWMQEIMVMVAEEWVEQDNIEASEASTVK